MGDNPSCCPSTRAIRVRPMSPDHAESRGDAPRSRRGGRHAQGNGTRTGGRGATRTPNRRRVPPALRIGVSVEPADVAARASQFRVLEADAGLEVLTDRVVAPWV